MDSLCSFRTGEDICHTSKGELAQINPSRTLIGLALLMAGLAHAATITVPCSGSGRGASGLIAAIETANGTTGANTINLTPGCVYVLSALYPGESVNGLPPITGTITINGYGATIERSQAVGTPNLRIFAVAASGTQETSPSTPSSSNAAKSSITI